MSSAYIISSRGEVGDGMLEMKKLKMRGKGRDTISKISGETEGIPKTYAGLSARGKLTRLSLGWRVELFILDIRRGWKLSNTFERSRERAIVRVGGFFWLKLLRAVWVGLMRVVVVDICLRKPCWYGCWGRKGSILFLINRSSVLERRARWGDRKRVSVGVCLV